MARPYVRPLNLFADYMAGRDAAQQERVNQQQNILRDQQLERSQRLNALSQNPQASPEDYIRAGDVQTGAALSSYQNQQQMDKQQALTQLAGLAQKALSIQDPAQRKAFLASPEVSTTFGPAFTAIGADHGKGIAELQQLPDAELQQRLSQVAQFVPPEKPIEVAAGGSLATRSPDGSYRAAFTAPKQNEAPNSVQEYEYARSQGYKGSFQQFQTQMKQAGAQQINLPSGYRWNPDGSMSPIAGGPADPSRQPPKPLTEGDKKNAVLFSSMKNAEQQINDLERASSSDTSSIKNRMLGASELTKPFQSEDFRKYESAALRWSANLLYLKSGATATPEEVESTRKQFFPQPGDSPGVKAQKEQARKQEIEAVRNIMVPGDKPSNPQSGSTPSAPTATGPNGQKLILQNGQWVPYGG